MVKNMPATMTSKAEGKKVRACKACRVIKVGTDFTGMNSVNVAMKRMLSPDKFKTVFSSEILPECKRLQDVMLKDQQPEIEYGDVSDRSIADMPYVDVYVATPPCQTFSNAGKGEGKDDSRGKLLSVAIKYTVTIKPRVMIIENVKGLMSKKFRPIIKGMTQALTTHGYKVWLRVVNSKDFYVPQSRERVYIVAIRNDSHVKSFKWPKPCARVSLSAILDPPAATDLPGRMPQTKTGRKNMNTGCQKAIALGVNPLQVPVAIDVDSSAKFFTMGIDEAKTLTRSRGGAKGPWITSRGRRTSMTELLKLQGFMESEVPWQSAGVSPVQLGRMLGNAVTVPVMGSIISAAMHSAGITRTAANFPDPRQ